MQGNYPSYLALSASELEDKVNEAWQMLRSCTLCPRACKVDRTKGQVGYCKTDALPFVSSWGPHFGEERPLVGRFGSGTVFFGKCNLQCVFCQNYDISILDEGMQVSFEALADIMLELQARGCHNINLVTPTHQMPMILKSLQIAISKGLHIPIVYNCGGYEAVPALKLLEGVVDIYMPDVKFASSSVSKALANAEDYFDRCKEALREMYRQVGGFKTQNGIAHKGMIIRHLLLPNNLAGTEDVLKFIAEELSTDVYLNIMDQYYPHFKAKNVDGLNTMISRQEYSQAISLAKGFGFRV